MGWGSLNPFKPGSVYEKAGQSVSNAVSSVGSVLAKIDPGPAIGNVGAQLDKGVRDVIPGGWAMVGAIALTIASMGTIDLEPEVLAAAAAEEGAAAGAGAGTAGDVFAGYSATGSAAGTAGTVAYSAPTALQAALSAAGTGALYGGGIGGANALIRGQDPLKGALMGALYGGLTGGALSGLESAGVPSLLAKALTTAATGAAQGQDITTLLQNSALNTGLSALTGNVIPSDVNPAITAAGTGAIKAAVTGRDPITGALMSAGNSLLGQSINAGKELYGNLTAPSADANINPATGQPWQGLAGAGDTTVNLAGVGTMGTDLAGRYLTAASEELSNKVTSLLPTIEEQRAALLGQADTVKGNYDALTTAQGELKTAINDKYNPVYQNVVALQTTASDLYSKITDLQSTYDTSKAAYEASNGSDTASFNTANNAATQLNALIPQYNTAAQEFSTANTQLTELYNSEIKPLVETYQTAKTNLDGSVSQFSTAQNKLTDIVDTAASYITGLTDISKGQLPTDYKAAELSMSAPTAQGFNNEELAAIQQGQQDAIASAGTGTQTAGGITATDVLPTTNEGALTVTNQAGGDKQGQVTVSLVDPTVDSNAVAGGSNLDQTPEAFPDSNSPTGYSDNNGDPVNEDGSRYTATPTNPDQQILDQVVANLPTDYGTSGALSNTPTQPTTPVDTGALPTTPIVQQPTVPVEIGALPTTPVDTGALPTTTTPPTTTADTGALPTTTTPPTTTADTGALPTTTTPPTTTADTGALPTTINTPTDVGTVIGGTTGGTGTVAGGTGTVAGDGTGAGTGTVTGGGADTTTTGGTTTTGTGTTTAGGTTTPSTTAGGLTAAGLASMLAGLNLGGTRATTGLSAVDTMPAAPKGTFVKGSQIASPLGSFNVPTINYATPAQDPNSLEQIENAATGGIMHLASGGSSEDDLSLKPVLMRGKQTQHANLFGSGTIPLYSVPGHADGGSIPQGFNPQFYSEGGLGSMQNAYVRGPGTGTSDSIPAMLSNGEFVIPADVVSSLGNGSNDSGAKVLDSFLKTIRTHKQKHDAKHLPAPSKGALGYLLEAKRKVKK